jgi:bifunctional DNA-binding transcriptional regulator/antitoxin component of YhaV-PrlF toxin-antitoxin module
METFRLAVKDKGRTVLPVGLQRACGFSAGMELVAHQIGVGRFVVETHDAVLERIWSGIPTGDSQHAVEELFEWRRSSDAERNRRLAEPVEADDSAVAGHGEQLLRALGL